jgi:surface protein
MLEMSHMSHMFCIATEFNADISRWDVSNVTDMKYMFHGAREFNSNISRWDVSNVTDMKYMFQYAREFNADISRWDVSNVTNMKYMLHCAANFTANIVHWPLYNTTSPTDTWVEIEMSHDMKLRLIEQDSMCPVLLATLTGRAVQCHACKYLFSEEIKSRWLSTTQVCPHCRSPWLERGNIYYRI